MKVKFSIITPTFNRAASGFLRECIISVREQTRGNYEYEHVIVDDGSTDETEKYIKSLKDNNIQYIYQKNAGTASATRTGINATNGDYIIILDDDDLLMEDSLKKRLQFIEKNPKVDFFYGNAQWIDKNGFLIKPLFNSKYYNDHQYERLLIENYINAGTPTAKSWLYKDIKWPSWLERSQDYFMWLEVFRPERKTKIGYLDELLVKYRWHQTAYTSAIHGDKEKIKEKELLNLKIKKLHPDNMVFMADQAKQKITEINRINENFQEETSELTRQLFLTREELGWFRMSRAIKVALKIRKSVRGAKDKAKMMPRIFISRTWMFLPASLRKTLKSILKKKTKTKIVDKDKWPAGEPLVSVVTPFYNHGETLPSTIDSVLNQTFQNFEYIIVNDGSNDEFSVNVIKSIKHPKIQVINQVNKGKGSPAAARNVGIKKAKGKYIMCLDADDIPDLYLKSGFYNGIRPHD